MEIQISCIGRTSTSMSETSKRNDLRDNTRNSIIRSILQNNDRVSAWCFGELPEDRSQNVWLSFQYFSWETVQSSFPPTWKIFWIGKAPVGFLYRLIHTARDRDREMMGFCIMLYTVHITQGQGQGRLTIVFYCTHPRPGPCPVPGPVQCEWAIT